MERDADVIIVGAGPGGSTTAYHLAQAGLDVVLLEKTAFPREKVCGDGLTPRAVKQLTAMGIDTSEQAGWRHSKGLRIIGGGHRLEVSWPELSTYPDYSLVSPRAAFDQMLAQHATKAGVHLYEQTHVSGPLFDERTGALTGVLARAVDERGRKTGPELRFRAPLVVAADGNSSRLSLAFGRQKRDDRPMGVAVRTYYRSPRSDEDWLETWLELWEGTSLLPGYGWIFPMGDGTVNVGLGILDTSNALGNVDYRGMLTRWVDQTPAEWGLRPENMTQPVRGAALPMGFNRKPHYARGLLLVGDAGGMVNPFNGEGIAYAMESGALAAEFIAQARTRTTAAGREQTLMGYPAALEQTYGGYYTLGRYFVELIGHPEAMRLATRHGLKRPAFMRFTLKLLANLTQPRGDVSDRIINALTRVTPSA